MSKAFENIKDVVGLTSRAVDLYLLAFVEANKVTARLDGTFDIEEYKGAR